MAFRDIRKSRRWLSIEEIRLLALLLLILAGLLTADLYLARIVPGGEWLYVRWSGARAFVIERITPSGEGLKVARTMPDGLPVVLLEQAVAPYGTEIAKRTQEVAYGRPAFSSEYTYVLNDPFFIVLLYTPLALIRDFSVVRALWMLLSQVALAATVWLALNLSEWQPPGWLYILVFVFGLLGYSSLNALATGTPTIFLAMIYLCILVALRSHSDELAGILMSLVAYQWEVGGLFFLFIIAFVFVNHRWGVLAGLAMSLFVLLMASFLVDSGWGLPYVRAVLSDWYRGANFTFGQMLSNWFPDTRFSIGSVVSIILGIVLFAEWLASFHAHFRRVVWTAALSLAATPLIGLAIFPSNHVVLILAFILVLALAWERWQRHRIWVSILIFLLLLLVPFGLYARSVYIYDPLVTDLVAVLPPIAAIMGLYWMRWWVLRSPRTWFDRIGDYR